MSLELLILLPAHFCLVNTKPLRAEKKSSQFKKKRKRERERETNIMKGEKKNRRRETGSHSSLPVTTAHHHGTWAIS